MSLFLLKPKFIAMAFVVAGFTVVLGLIWLRFQLADLGRLTVRIFDVGQGDAILVTTPSGRQILVDGGPDNTLLHKVGRVMPAWDRTIELVVLSHPHADHVAGLVELARRYRLQQVLISGVKLATPEYEAFAAELRRQGMPVITAQAPVTQLLEPGLELRVLHPPGAVATAGNPNNASVVLQVVYGGTEVLLTGDLEAEAQGRLPAAWLASDVLKVPHQGSADALNPEVLAAIAPKLAVISVGPNRYGHPSPRVIRALERQGATVLTTQAAGDVTVASDGRAASVATQRFGRLRQLIR